MGKKSRLKQERKQKDQSNIKAQVTNPVNLKTREFLNQRGLSEDATEKLAYLTSMLVNFAIYRLIKQSIQLPSVKPEHEKLDGSRIEGLHKELEDECRHLGLEAQEVIDEVVTPLGRDESIVQQILANLYNLLETLIPTENFRKMTEEQIQDVESWGDSLDGYEARKEDYFEALKEIFALNLSVVRSGVDGGSAPVDLHVGLEDIRQHYDLPSNEFEKLVRRATEFLRVSFANYLEIDFQGVRLELHARSYGIKAEEDGL